MLIDFAKAHHEYLQGWSENGCWVFKVANPTNPLAWKHLASHQIFSNNALGLAIAVRNDVTDKGAAKAVFTSLRMNFSSKVGGRYPLKNDPSKVSLTLGIESVRYLYSWLRGHQPTFRYDLIRKGETPKSLYGFRSDSHFTHMLRVSTSTSDGSTHQIDVGLDAGHTFAIVMFCVGFAQLLYPSFSSQLIAEHLLIDHKDIAAGKGSQESPENHSHANTIGGPTYDRDVQGGTQAHSMPATSPERQKAQKAIYAVGMNKWDRKDLQVIEYIQQSAASDVMDRLIKAGNRGDFTEWERLRSFFHSIDT